mgnify:CR=1 FL=1
MKIKDEYILKIFQGSDMHILIIVLSFISISAFISLSLIFKKKKTNKKFKTILNYVLYAICIFVALMMLFNPSILYQFVFITKQNDFYLNTYLTKTFPVPVSHFTMQKDHQSFLRWSFTFSYIHLCIHIFLQCMYDLRFNVFTLFSAQISVISRYSFGVTPYLLLNWRLKFERLVKPAS